METKKRVEIEVIAKLEKFKTGLQKLKEHLKGNNEVEVSTTKAQARLIQVQQRINALKKEISKTSEFGNTSENFNFLVERLDKAQKQAEKLKQQIKGVGDEQEKTNKKAKASDLTSIFKNANKDAKRFVLSLFSVRSAWSIISRASQNYLSNNEEDANRVNTIWTFLGEVVGGIIHKIVGWIQYGIAYLNVFIKSLTGIDFLSRAISKSIQKSADKSSKAMSKTLSSMDEIINLEEQSRDDSAGGVANALQDIADLKLNENVVNFLERLGKGFKDVFNWGKKAWDFLEKHLGTTGAMAIVGGLALIIGGASTGGVVGLTVALGVLAGVSLANIIKQTKDLKSASDDTTKGVENSVGRHIDFLDKLGGKLDSVSQENMKRYLDAEKNSIESTENVIDGLNRKYSWYEKLSGIYDNNMKQKDLYNQQLDKEEESLNTIINYYTEQNKKLDVNSEEYRKNADLIKQAEDNLKKINGYRAKATIELDANTSKARGVIGDFFQGIKDGLGSLWYGLQGKSYKMGTWATGGFPEEGQMFIANEAGPELVGTIGGSTAVVNNAQIVESVSKGVASAVASVMGTQKQTSSNAQYLYINGREVAQAIYSDLEDEELRRGKNASIRRA